MRLLQVEEIQNFLNRLLNRNSYSYFMSHLQHHFHVCALFLALLATILIFPFRQNSPSTSPHQSLITDDHDDDSESFSLPSTSSEFEDENDQEEEEKTGEYFQVKGSSGGFIRRRSIGDFLSLSEIANSRSVVKLWDHKGFGFEHSGLFSGGSIVSVYKDQGLRPTGDISPAVVVSGNLALRIWDTRLRRGVMAESGGVQKVYVSDDGRYGLTIGDMTNVRSPLQDESESRFDSWMPNSFMLKIYQNTLSNEDRKK